jgi:hypothetical protein
MTEMDNRYVTLFFNNNASFLVPIAENSDYNIDPGFRCALQPVFT